MKNFLNLAFRTLLAAASRRASNVLRKQSEIAAPSNVDYRLNAGGWN